MRIEINDKVNDLKISLKCIRKLNEKYKKESQSQGINLGLSIIYASLKTYDPEALLIMADCAQFDGDNLSKKDLEDWIETVDVGEWCDDFLELLETAPMTKKHIAIVKQDIERNIQAVK